MSHLQDDHAYMQTLREVRRLENQLINLDNERERIGTDLMFLAKDVLQRHPVWNINRPTAEADWNELWNMMESHQLVTVELTDKQAELDGYDFS